jgi:hypothetical protein
MPRFSRALQRSDVVRVRSRLALACSRLAWAWKNEREELYQRPPFVDVAIARGLAMRQSECLRAIPHKPSEALVYFIRNAEPRDEILCGLMFKEPSKRTVRIIQPCVGGLAPLSAEHLTSEMEGRIRDLILAKEPSAKIEFLEITFEPMVQKEVYNKRGAPFMRWLSFPRIRLTSTSTA